MQFDLGRRADYAVRCVLDLARHHGHERRKAKEVAAAMDVPRSYVPSILASLVDVGLVSSTAGPRGGYELTRSPGQVTLLEVIEATEGPLASTTCVLRGGPCRWEGHCAVHEPWSRAQDAMRDELGDTTYADLLAIDERLEADEAERVAAAPGDPRP